jgi:hypothetical protein
MNRLFKINGHQITKSLVNSSNLENSYFPICNTRAALENRTRSLGASDSQLLGRYLTQPLQGGHLGWRHAIVLNASWVLLTVIRTFNKYHGTSLPISFQLSVNKCNMPPPLTGTIIDILTAPNPVLVDEAQQGESAR